MLLRDAAADLDTSVRRERTELNQLSSEGVPLKPPLVYLIIFQEVTYSFGGVEGCGSGGVWRVVLCASAADGLYDDGRAAVNQLARSRPRSSRAR